MHCARRLACTAPCPVLARSIAVGAGVACFDRVESVGHFCFVLLWPSSSRFIRLHGHYLRFCRASSALFVSDLVRARVRSVGRSVDHSHLPGCRDVGTSVRKKIERDPRPAAAAHIYGDGRCCCDDDDDAHDTGGSQRLPSRSGWLTTWRAIRRRSDDDDGGGGGSSSHDDDFANCCVFAGLGRLLAAGTETSRGTGTVAPHNNSGVSERASDAIIRSGG